MRTKKIVIFLILVFVPTFLYGNDSILIGIYYFPGWKKNDWHWNVYKPLKSFDNREPITGWERLDTTDFMKKEINWAAKHRVDFFAFDWFWNFNKKIEHRNYAIRNFVKLNKSIKFCIMWSVHGKLSPDLKEYIPIIKTWIQYYLSNSFYLKVNNKPLIFIFDFGNLIKSLGVINTRKLINILKKETNAFLVAIDNGPYTLKKQKKILDIGFDAISGWNYLGYLKKNYKINVCFYSTYKLISEKIYNQIYNNSRMPIFPVVLPGYNNSPMTRHPKYILLNSNPDDFMDMLQEAYCILAYTSHKPKIIMIESWNELDEGSYVIPTKKFGFQYLEKIKLIKEKFKCE